MAGGAEIDDFDLGRLERFEEDIFRFEVAVDESCILEDGEGIEKLSHEDFDELGAETLELILFDEFIEVGGEELKDETEMVSVDEGVAEAKDVVLVGGIEVLVQELEDGDLHHGLIKVGWLVFDDLDGDDLVGSDVLAFDDLTKGSLAEDVEYEVLVGIVGTEIVVDVENVVIVVVVVAVVVGSLAGFCEDATGVVSGKIAEGGITDTISLDEMGGELAKGGEIKAVCAETAGEGGGVGTGMEVVERVDGPKGRRVHGGDGLATIKFN